MDDLIGIINAILDKTKKNNIDKRKFLIFLSFAFMIGFAITYPTGSSFNGIPFITTNPIGIIFGIPRF